MNLRPFIIATYYYKEYTEQSPFDSVVGFEASMLKLLNEKVGLCGDEMPSGANELDEARRQYLTLVRPQTPANLSPMRDKEFEAVLGWLRGS